jgi:hypothetical protein
MSCINFHCYGPALSVINGHQRQQGTWRKW